MLGRGRDWGRESEEEEEGKEKDIDGSGVTGRKRSGKEFESRRRSERKGWRNSNTYSI